MITNRDSSVPVNQICLLACDMPRRLAAAFVSEMCMDSMDSRQEVESQLDRVTLAELSPFPENSDIERLATELARQARQPSSQRSMPDLDRREILEWLKLDQKLRWIEKTPIRIEDRLSGLHNDSAAELVRSECISRALFDSMISEEELRERFPELISRLDIAAIEEAARSLEAGGAPIRFTRFDIVRKIGSGGMGQVYEAIDREQNMRVALKTMTRTRAVDLFRFKQEFRSLADIVHPNLVRLYELVSDGHSWLYTMELVDGVDFRTWVRHIKRADVEEQTAFEAPATLTLAAVPVSTLSDSIAFAPDRTFDADIPRLRDALRQLVEGVHAVHGKGKLHRDLKPSNVLVQPDGRVVVLDFGLVKDLRESLSSETASIPRLQIAGSPLYMSPEQAEGLSDSLTEASDWYSVGVMLFEAITSVYPFGDKHVIQRKQLEEAPPIHLFAHDAPEDLASLCRRLLSRDPAGRPTGEQLLAELSGGKPGDKSAAREDTGDSFAVGPFVGREKHLERLAEAFTALLHGRSTMVHVFGSSGAGKSVLVQHFLRRIREIEGVVLLTGRCYEQESVPYKALDSLIDALTTFLLSLPLDESERLLPDTIAALAAMFPVMARVPAIQLARDNAARSTANYTAADPIELRRLAFEALRHLLRRLGGRNRLILYIDDLQWGDFDSAGVLGDLLRGLDPPRVMFLASYRAEHRDTSACVRALPRETLPSGTRVDELEVTPLDEGEAAQLALELLGPDRAEDALRIAQESRGLPFFVFELARHAPAGLDGRALDLDETLWMRIVRLPEISRRLMEAIAVAGQPVALRHVYRAAGIDSAGLPGIETLRGGNLIRRSGPGLDAAVESYHDRIRETVTARVDVALLRGYHHALAASLEADGGNDFEFVAVHYRGAGEKAKAAGYFEKAADQANAALAFDRAARLYRQVIELRNPRGEQERSLRRSLAEALGKAGRGADAAREYLAAANVIADEEAFRLQERAAYQFCVSGLIDEGRATFGGVIKHLGLRLPATRQTALFGLLRRRVWLTIRGLGFQRRAESEVPRKELDRIDLLWAVTGGLTMIDPIPGAQCQVQQLLYSLRCGEPTRVMRALAWEATHVSMLGLGYKGRVDRLLAEAEALATEQREPYSMGLLALSRSVSAYFLSDPRQCREWADKGAVIFREQCAGAAWELDQCNAFAYWSCYHLGDLAELSRRQAVLLRAAQERGSRLAESQLTTYAGPFVWLANDDAAAAKEAVEQVSKYWDNVEYQVYHFTLLTARTQILLYEGRGAEALAMMEREWSSVKRAMLLHVEIVNIYMHFLRGRCALAAGNLGAAAKDRKALSRINSEFAAACGDQIGAALSWRSGDGVRTRVELDRAIAGFERAGFMFFARSAAYRRAQLFRADSGESKWMAEQGIRNPEAMIQVNAPGFDSEST